MEINELRKVFTCRAPSSPEEQKRLYAFLRLNGVEPGEIYQGVEMSSAYVNTHHDTGYSNAMMNLHSHLFYEIICCTNTCDVEYLVGTERYRLQKGDIIFVAPGVSHKAILPERMPVPYERDVLWLSERFAELMKEMLPAGEQNLRMGTQLLRTAGTRWEAIPELFRRGVLEFEKGEAGAELAIAGNTMTIVASLIRASLDPTTAPLRAEKPVSGKTWACGFTGPTLYAAFPHLYLAGRPELAARFAEAARNYERKREQKDGTAKTAI